MRTSLHCLLVLSLSGVVAVVVGCARNPVAVNPEGDAVAKAPPPPRFRAGGENKSTPAKEKSVGGTSKTTGSDEPGFSFPDDQGGKLLAELLRPAERLPLLSAEVASGPRPLPAPATVGRPNPALPITQAGLPRPRLDPRAQPVRPRELPEDAPLTAYRDTPLVPQRQDLLAGATVRLESVDIDQPVALPTLAQPVADRASLDDATNDASIATALAAKPPVRSTPTPFQRLSLPDPFELAQVIRLAKPPAEDPAPASSTTRPARP